MELGQIAVWRQERWAEEVLAEALTGLTTALDRGRCFLLLAQRALLLERKTDAQSHLDNAKKLAHESGCIGLQAKCYVTEGDLFRLLGQLENAQEAWKTARESALASGEEEVLLRPDDSKGRSACHGGPFGERLGGLFNGVPRLSAPSVANPRGVGSASGCPNWGRQRGARCSQKMLHVL